MGERVGVRRRGDEHVLEYHPQTLRTPKQSDVTLGRTRAHTCSAAAPVTEAVAKAGAAVRAALAAHDAGEAACAETGGARTVAAYVAVDEARTSVASAQAAFEAATEYASQTVDRVPMSARPVPAQQRRVQASRKPATLRLPTLAPLLSYNNHQQQVRQQPAAPSTAPHFDQPPDHKRCLRPRRHPFPAATARSPSPASHRPQHPSDRPRAHSRPRPLARRCHRSLLLDPDTAISSCPPRAQRNPCPARRLRHLSR